MAKAAKPTAAAGIDVHAIPESAKAKLRRLVVKNFCCIGSTPVEIDLDDIVVLVGPNNAGKSTILRAYEMIMKSSAPKLSLEDFFGRKVDEHNLPTVELHTAVAGDLPASKWIQDADGEKIVRERWIWSAPETTARREGWDVTISDWAVDAVPWGAANVSNSRRPIPHRIEAFADPATQVEEVTELLLSALTDRFKKRDRYERDSEGKEKLDKDNKPILTQYGALLNSLAENQKTVVAETKAEIGEVEEKLTKFVDGVFSGYEVTFDARAEDDLTKALNFFKAGATLRMGPKGGHLSDPTRQGSGARRTLMWAALRYIAESDKKVKAMQAHLLLLDEPELCLHPNAIREACSTLYALPTNGAWQVMLTTHSPAFIDLSRDNTTVVRVERQADNTVRGTTVFRPSAAKLSTEEKEELKLLNLYDPHVAEFFFGGRTILVEGDTEYTGFRWAIAQKPADFKDVHIVRARGKVTIALLAKILNAFSARYAVLHDSDLPKVKTKNGEITNPAWTNNQKILSAVKPALDANRARLIAALPCFETALFGESQDEEKPYNAYTTLKADAKAAENVSKLLSALLDFAKSPPGKCADWNDLALLEKAVSLASHTPPA